MVSLGLAFLNILHAWLAVFINDGHRRIRAVGFSRGIRPNDFVVFFAGVTMDFGFLFAEFHGHFEILDRHFAEGGNPDDTDSSGGGGGKTLSTTLNSSVLGAAVAAQRRESNFYPHSSFRVCEGQRRATDCGQESLRCSVSELRPRQLRSSPRWGVFEVGRSDRLPFR